MTDTSTEPRYAALRESAALPEYANRLDHFGPNDHGYDLGGEDGLGNDDMIDDAFGDGAPGRTFAREALLTWAKLWDRFDIATAAAVFNFEPGLIDELAIRDEDWTGKPPVGLDVDRVVQMVASQRIHLHPDAVCEGETLKELVFVTPTCAEIAALLNLQEGLVSHIVENHPWMFLGQERDGSREIEHDGE